MDSANPDSEEEASTSGVDDATLERAASLLFKRFPVPKARLRASSVLSITKSLGIDLQENLAEYVGDKAMKELRYVILLATQFSRHERALGLRASDFDKAAAVINGLDPLNRGNSQVLNQHSQEKPPETTAVASSIPQVFLHRFSPDEEESDKQNSTTNTGTNVRNSDPEEREEEEGWQDYGSNATTSSGDKESPGNSSEGSASAGGSANPEQQYEGPDSNDQGNNSDNNDMEFDSKMLPDSCDDIENEIGDEFLEEIEHPDPESDYAIHQVIVN